MKRSKPRGATTDPYRFAWQPLQRATTKEGRLASSWAAKCCQGRAQKSAKTLTQLAEEADQLLEELFVVCEEIAFLSQAEAEELEWRVDQLKAAASQEEEETPEPLGPEDGSAS